MKPFPTQPDVNLSAHPAPIIQPKAKSPFVNGRTAEVHVVRQDPASVPPGVFGDEASCISCVLRGFGLGNLFNLCVKFEILQLFQTFLGKLRLDVDIII